MNTPNNIYTAYKANSEVLKIIREILQYESYLKIHKKHNIFEKHCLTMISKLKTKLLILGYDYEQPVSNRKL